MSAVLPPTIPHAAAQAAQRWGDAPAILLPDRAISFADLWHDIRAAASVLAQDGLRSGDRIGIWAPNSAEWIVIAVAAQLLGAAIVPLNTRLKGSEAADQLRRARCSMLFMVGNFLGVDYSALLQDHNLPDLRTVHRIDDIVTMREWIASGIGAEDPAVDAALAALRPDMISDIIYTSGTTGSPKGAMHSHATTIPVFANWAAVTDLRASDRYLIVNPFFHTFGYKAGWVAALLTGATMIPMATFDAAQAARHIADDCVAFLPGAPTIFDALLNERDRHPFDSSALRVAVTGAATVPPVLVRRMHDELGFDTVVTGYGMTECGNITMCRAGDPIERVAFSCGRAVPELDLRIVDDDGAVLPPDKAGEIVVRGRGVMLGYLDDPAATAEAIDAGGWLHTGDIGMLDADGYLRITDRKKDMYISGGFNVYPAEVEKLFAHHPAVSAVAVVGVPDDRLGEVGAAFVVLRPGQQVSAADIMEWARSAMANYKAPRHINIVDDLPRNASGKVMKNLLRTSA